MTKTKIFMVMLAVFLPTIVLASDPWPASDASGTQIANYAEASGIVYHERLGTLFIVLNSGCVKQINLEGNELSSWCPSSWVDLEGITIADDDNYLYLGLESPQTIYEFSISANNLTGKSWVLSGMNVASGQGLEALEYVNGYFYAGSQYDAKVYVYQVDINNSGTGALINSFYPYSGYTTDLSALSYSQETDTLYALYDGNNRLVTSNGDRYQLPSGTMNEEGFVVVPNCPNSTTYAVIAEDSGRIMKFSNFSIDNTRCITEPDPDLDDIVIVNTSSSGIPYIQDVLDDNYHVSIISMEELKSGVPVGTEVLIYPGGADFLNYINTSSLALDAEIQASLQNFEGGIVAICGGSVVMSDKLQTNYYGYPVSIDMADKVPITAVDYDTWLSESVNTLSFNDHVILGDYANGIHDVDYYGGPVFENYGEATVLATYTEQIQNPYYDNIGKPAIIVKNNIVLSAVHPEYKSETHFLLENMVAYANGELIEPEPVDNDGDGYPAENDCNDNDATINPAAAEICNTTDDDCDGSTDEGLTVYTYYRDEDNDTLGSKINYYATCTTSAMNGYVSNNNDYDDTLSNYGIEIYGDGVDNDGDAKIDEVNTVAENGYHPGLLNIDPSNGQYLVSYAGMRNGKIKVAYSDESIYVYQIFDVKTVKYTTVAKDGNTAKLKVTDARNRRTVLVNGYTGQTLQTLTQASKQKKRAKIMAVKHKKQSLCFLCY